MGCSDKKESHGKKPHSKGWVYFTDNWYYNKVTIQAVSKSSDVISVWTYYTPADNERRRYSEVLAKKGIKNSTKYDHTITKNEFDCKRRLIRLKEHMDFDDKGNMINFVRDKNGEWKSIATDSIMEILFKIVCVTQ